MTKKEFVCMECDAHFTVSIQRGYEILFCPNCGESIEQEDAIDLLEEDV